MTPPRANAYKCSDGTLAETIGEWRARELGHNIPCEPTGEGVAPQVWNAARNAILNLLTGDPAKFAAILGAKERKRCGKATPEAPKGSRRGRKPRSAPSPQPKATDAGQPVAAQNGGEN